MAAVAQYGRLADPLAPIAGPSSRANPLHPGSPPHSPARLPRSRTDPANIHRQALHVQPGQPGLPGTAAAPTSPNSRKKQPGAEGTKRSKPILPSPPKVIVGSNGVAYQRKEMLGQGGFARVYEVLDPRGTRKALKVIAKSAIMPSKKNRQKLLAEIMIHRSLSHHHIVRFEDVFEDDQNVYFRLELCASGSMNDIVKRRGRYTEPEARYFMVQILAGCQNMHANYVIHRDLKLGNIFLDHNMNVKIGDFGLAALLKYPEERKKTMCGTPNYIAPEVLFDQGEGHSFEVDVWSVGVILYTLLVGKPPFQTTNVQKIYEKIKHNDYAIPPEANVSPEAQMLIRQILTPIPAERPTLSEIMRHPWFLSGPIPTAVSHKAIREHPRFPPMTREESHANFARVKREAGWDEDADAVDEVAKVEPRNVREELREQEQAEESRERMDKEFKKALQPGSPISALLKAGRQPLVKAPQTNSVGRGVGSELARKLGALTLSRAQPTVKVEGTDVLGVRADKENAGPSAPTPGLIYRNLEQGHVHPRAEEMAEERRIMNQKARLVAGMNAQAGSAVSVASVDSNTGRRQAQLGDDGVKPTPIPSVVPSRDATAMAKKAYSSVELIIRNLGEALQCLDAGLEFEPVDDEGQPVSIPTEDVVEENGDRREAPAGPRVFIISWLDHSERYGLGYAMSDGSVGVHFRDSTSMTLSALKGSFDYISTIRPRTTSTTSLAPPTSVPSQSAKDQLRRENFNLLPTEPGAGAGAGLEGIPRELAPKVKVMRFFENEIMERLYGADSPLTWVDEETTTGMVFVHKWYRCHQAIVFRLSNAAIQFNFYDHTKVFLTHDGLVVSAIEPIEKTDGVQVMRTWTVPELLAIARPGRSAEEEEAALEALRVGGPPRLARTTPRERRLARALAKKLRYAREVLITTTSGPRGPRMGANGGPHAPTRSGSTASLAPQAAAAANGQGLGIARSGSATSIASAASTASTALGTKAMRA